MTCFHCNHKHHFDQSRLLRSAKPAYTPLRHALLTTRHTHLEQSGALSLEHGILSDMGGTRLNQRTIAESFAAFDNTLDSINHLPQASHELACATKELIEQISRFKTA